MLIPLIVPMAQIFGISAQLCVLAFAFGDGFSNVLYPTNPVLLISLGLADVNYVGWVKWSGRFQFLNLVVTCGLLLLGLVLWPWGQEPLSAAAPTAIPASAADTISSV